MHATLRAHPGLFYFLFGSLLLFPVGLLYFCSESLSLTVGLVYFYFTFIAGLFYFYSRSLLTLGAPQAAVAAGDMHPENMGEEEGGGAHVRGGKEGAEEEGLVMGGGRAWEGAMQVKRYKLPSPEKPPPGMRVRVRVRVYIAHYIFADLYCIFAGRRVILLSCRRFARQNCSFF